MWYLPLPWQVRQSGAAVKHYDVILTLGLHTTGHVVQTPKGHVPLLSRGRHPSQSHPQAKHIQAIFPQPIFQPACVSGTGLNQPI